MLNTTSSVNTNSILPEIISNIRTCNFGIRRYYEDPNTSIDREQIGKIVGWWAIDFGPQHYYHPISNIVHFELRELWISNLIY